jgi:O-antigen ligase
VRTPESLRRVIWTLIAAGALISLAPLYQQVTGQFNTNMWGFGQVSDAAFNTDIASQYGPVQPRLAGSVGEQNRYAQVMLMLVPLALFRLWAEPQRYLRILAVIATLLISTAVMLTFSRGAAVGFVAIVLAMASMRYIQTRHLSLVVFGMAVLLITFPQYTTRLAKLQGLWDLVEAEGVSGGEADGAIKSRFTEMAAAGLVFLDHPLIGVGPGMFRFYYREYAEQVGLKVFAKGRGAHSLYPGLAAESGMAGSVLFFSIMIITLRDLVRARRRCVVVRPELANIAASFVLVLIAYLTTAIFLHFAYVRFFWLLMALAHVASRVGREYGRAPSAIPQVSS